MPHRLFIAVALPDAVRQRLASLVADACSGVRPVRAEQVHLTLHFLGDADDAALARLAAALQRIRQDPFTIDLVGTGMFPPRGRPAVLWAGVGPCEPLRQLHGTLATVLGACGFVVDSRPWVPHVTLARLSRRVAIAWTSRFLERHRHLVERAIPVTAVRLYESMRTAAGAVHVPVVTVRLPSLDGCRYDAASAAPADIPPRPATSVEKPVHFRPSGP